MTSIANNTPQEDTDSDDSDDELDIFSKLNAMAARAGENARQTGEVGEDQEEKYERFLSIVRKEMQALEFDLLLPYLRKQAMFVSTDAIEQLPEAYREEMKEIKTLVQYFIDGRYLDLIASPSIYKNIFAPVAENAPVFNDDSKDDKSKNAASVDKASNTISSSVRDIYRASVALRERCATFIQSGVRNISSADDDSEDDCADGEIKLRRFLRVMKVLLAGAASLNLYVQANWTGPPINFQNVAIGKDKELKFLWLLPMLKGPNSRATDDVVTSFSSEGARAACRLALETEGFSSYPHCETPECLVVARTIFGLLNGPLQDNNNSGLKWCDRDPISLGITDSTEDAKRIRDVRCVAAMLKSTSWWSARSTVAHHRTLSTTIEGSENLKRNAKDEFEMAIRLHPFLDEARNMVKNNDATVCAQLHLEWGLAQHYWNETKGAKSSIRQAQAITGLSANISGAIGVRGKWSKETAQMVLLAESADGPSDVSCAEEKEKVGNNTNVNHENANAECVNSENNDDTDLLKDRSSKAKVKEILLEEIDPDTPLLERIKFSKESPYKNDLVLIDQAIVLGLCVDVSNQNPKHGLTNEQMSAYVARVMNVESTRNWMVYTTSLITKSFVEYERWKTKERSVLQLQALVDQHTNRISAGQMPTTDINAPANERMAIIYGLVMPPLFEMKRQLADRYMGIYVKRSALELYRELELWEDVVQCLLDTTQDDEALSLVTKQLEVKPSPMLWCCLGELEDNDDHFRTAWKLSNQRYARSMRLLGKRLFHRDEYEASIECYLASLSVRPQEHHAWWRVGTASMRIEKWTMALRAWTHCARIEPTDGEAWGNMGAVYCRLNKLDEAYNAFDQGLKQQRQNWKMWENFMLLSLRTRRYGRTLYAQEQLLNLRDKRDMKDANKFSSDSASGVDLETVNVLTNVITTSLDCKRDPALLETLDEVSKEKIFDNFNTPASFHAPRLRRLFETIEKSVSASPPLWALYGQLCCSMGDMKKARECCSTELRVLKSMEDWEKDEEFCMNITRTTLRFVELANTKLGDPVKDKEAQENAKMVLNSTIKSVEKFYKDSEMMKMLEVAVGV